MARPVIAKKLVEIARKEGAVAICHGATGKGNDQIRFELGIKALAPDIKVIAPWRMTDVWTMQSREDEIEYCKKHGIDLPFDHSHSYSRDRNLWHISHEGFLSLRAGFQGIDKSGYEAGAIEGIKNRFQELLYITIPAMGPQLLFAAVMQITSSFTAGDIGRFLTAFPSTDYAAHTIMTHAFDYGSVRYEMGYACAICFLLFIVMILVNNVIRKAMAGRPDSQTAVE